MSNHVTIQPKILYFGTPVALITTVDEQGSPNIAPMSSVWSLGYNLMLGLGCTGKTYCNLIHTRECVVNFPDALLHTNVEQIARLTGITPVPDAKKSLYTYEADKFAAGGFTAMPAEKITPPAISECPLQLEAVYVNHHIIEYGHDGMPDIAAVQVKVVNVRADAKLILNSNHIDRQNGLRLFIIFDTTLSLAKNWVKISGQKFNYRKQKNMHDE